MFLARKPAKLCQSGVMPMGTARAPKANVRGAAQAVDLCNAVKGNEIVSDHQQNQDAKASGRTRGRRDPDPIPWKTTKCGFD